MNICLQADKGVHNNCRTLTFCIVNRLYAVKPNEVDTRARYKRAFASIVNCLVLYVRLFFMSCVHWSGVIWRVSTILYLTFCHRTSYNRVRWSSSIVGFGSIRSGEASMQKIEFSPTMV